MRAVRGSVLRLPFPDAAFDAVTSFDVIYHDWVADDRAAVAEMARVLRPGGALLVRVPALEALRGAHDAEVLTRRRYTRGELGAARRARGLERRALELLQLAAVPAAASPAARSTGCSGARARTWASCRRSSSGCSAA